MAHLKRLTKGQCFSYRAIVRELVVIFLCDIETERA